MKWVVIPILLFLILTQVFGKWIVVAEFNIYRNYIAKNLCENRYRPMLHCNGKCVLMKKMAAEENQSSLPGNVKLNVETFLFVDTHVEYLGKNFPIFSKRFAPLKFYYHSQPFLPAVFHPPLS